MNINDHTQSNCDLRGCTKFMYLVVIHDSKVARVTVQLPTAKSFRFIAHFHRIEVEGISRVGGQVGEERHSGSIRLVHKHGISMLQNVVDGASMPHREG
jgi:hypothetical protein